jgi:TatD DNase family protein
MAQTKENKFAYYLGTTMYVNVTNLCTNECIFCIRNSNDSVGGVNLMFKNEDFTQEDIIKEIKDKFSDICREITFCGIGEPLIKIEIVKNVARYIKDNYPHIPVRVNTNGQANLIHKRNIVPELKGLIDRVSVSLNADNEDLYEELSCPSFEKKLAFEGIKDFIKECAKNGLDTTATIVTGYGEYDIDVESCRQLAHSLGAKLRIREWLPNGYES